MLKLSKGLLLTAGFLFIADSSLIVLGIENPLFGWPLPCPVTMIVFGLGLILFCLSSEAFKS